MTDSLLPTARLVADADRYIRTPNRIALLDTRNKLRGRVALLEGRLTTADEKFPHAPLDRMPHTDLYLQLEAEYRSAFDALTRADAAL
jgi:hypothetical protein